MRRPLSVGVLVLGLLVASTPVLAAQQPALTIRSVTFDTSGDLLTITGSGFGAAPAVTIDDQPVTVLAGSNDTEVLVQVPAALKTTPGTYRLTVVDPIRQLGDTLAVVAPQVATVSGVATAFPTTKLDIVTETNDGLRVSDGTTLGVFFPSGILGNSLAFGTQSNHPFIFGTNNSFDRLTIAANGNVGIGTLTPAAKFDVTTGINDGLRLSDGTLTGILFASGYLGGSFAFGTQTNHAFIFGTNDTWGRLTIAANGNIGIGTLTPSQPLQMASGAYVSAGGVWTNASSRALKQDIADLSAAEAENAFARLAPVTFTYTAEPAQTHVGFIAEDVPELVATADRKSLSAMDLVALLTRVLQVKSDELSQQRQTVEELRRSVDDLRARLAQLEEAHEGR